MNCIGGKSAGVRCTVLKVFVTLECMGKCQDDKNSLSGDEFVCCPKEFKGLDCLKVT